MKRFLFLLLLPTLSFAQTGSISGNAFYHYNDFVGDKPDAGASVYLFFDSTNMAPVSTQCDVQGNYRFEKVKPGKYMVMVVSQNAYEDGTFILERLESRKGTYSKFLGFDITDIHPCYDSISILDSAFIQAASKKMTAWNTKKVTKGMDDAMNAAHAQRRHVLDEVYKHASFYPKLAFAGLLHKVDFSVITIAADQNRTIITNFGISR